MSALSPDLTRKTLAVLFIGGLIAASVWILLPFVPALVWAAMIVVATWPLMLRAQKRLWGRRWLATTAMTLAMLLVFVVPLSAAIGVVVSNAEEIAGWAKSLGTLQLPRPPDWLHKLPLVGDKASAAWRELAASGPEELAGQLQPYARRALAWFTAEVGNLGVMAFQFLLTIAFAAILYLWGESAAGFVRRFATRLAGTRGDDTVTLTGQAIRAVALGVIVTAIVQALLGGIGLVVAGVPLPGLLTAAMLLLAVAQIGVVPVLLCAVASLYWKGEPGAAIGLLAWSAFVSMIDYVLRPVLIRQGADLPLLLIFAGVIGGLLALGLVGIFVGPVVLAVTYTLLVAWMDDSTPAAERSPR